MRLTVLCLLLTQAVTAATISINGTQTAQTIEALGVNINSAWWTNGVYGDAFVTRPAIDRLVNELGATVFRAVIEEMDWEATNDNADPASFNWTYYNAVFANAKFTGVWNTLRYLNQKGITDRLMISFMGAPPAWMGSDYTVSTGMEDEFVESIAALLYYARHTAGVQFTLVSPMNETELDGREGPNMKDPVQFTRILDKLSAKLDAIRMGDIRFVSPDAAGQGMFDACFDRMIQNSSVMGKLACWGVHNYGSDSTGYWNKINNSSIASDKKKFWVTETAVIANLLSQLDDGNVTSFMFWDGFDCVYQHGIRNGYGNVPPNDWVFWEGEPGKPLIAYEAATQQWPPRKQYYQFAQVFKFVRPGAQRVTVTGSTAPFSPLLAFKQTGLGQVTIVGINTSGSSASLTGTVTALPAVASLDLYYTSATTNLARAGSVPVNSGTFTATIPANCVFTLTGTVGVNVALTNPVNNAQFNAPATIALAATATTSTGSIVKVEFYNGATKLGEDSAAPYDFSWSSVPMGDYALTARATNTVGGVGTSAVVNVTVAGPLAQVTVAPSTATVVAGGPQQFTATGRDALGHVLNPQPVFTWTVTGGGTINAAGLFTAGSVAGGPFNVTATSAGLTGTATVSVATIGGGTIGNTSDGTASDNIWDSGAYINACRHTAGSNMVVSVMHVKVVALTGHYKCAIYRADNSLLASTTELTNPPTNGWYELALTSAAVLTGGSNYWLAVWSDSANARVYYNGTGTLQWMPRLYGDWPPTFATTGGSSLNYCLYATGTTAPPPYDQWKTGYGLASAADTSDGDGDGIPLLMEYALAGNPHVADSASLSPVIGLTIPSSARHLTLTYTKNKAATDVTILAEVTGNVTGTWSSATLDVDQSWQVTDGLTLQTITARDKTPVTDATSRFMRLKITRP